MEKLNYEVLKKSGYDGYILGKGAAPVKVLQFGEGNFLRAFVDYWFDMSNELAGWNGKVALVQPIAQGLTDLINEQEGLYTLYLRGSENGEKVNRKRVISVVDACYNPYKDWEAVKAIARSKDLEYVASNTTEAGIVYDPDSKFDQVPPVSFPAKLTVLLYERFKAGQKGVTILSCELIDNNGQELRKCVLKHIEDWGLGEDFRNWVENENLFCSTLVDRIVPASSAPRWLTVSFPEESVIRRKLRKSIRKTATRTHFSMSARSLVYGISKDRKRSRRNCRSRRPASTYMSYPKLLLTRRERSAS